MTTRAEIREWLEHAQFRGATHVIVVCDTFDGGDYPVQVMPGEDLVAKVTEYNDKPMSRVMEVYALHLDLEAQLREYRAYHLEMPPAPEPAADGG
jgi:hypothetical protein